MRFWPLTHSAWASEMIQCRNGARMGVFEFGASGSATIRVYFVVIGSTITVSKALQLQRTCLPKPGSAVKLNVGGVMVSDK